MDELSTEPTLTTDTTELGSWRPRPADTPTSRYDAFTGDRMAKFCEVLAETDIVTDACLAVGINRDTAYSNRRRNPLFDAAWQAALSIARNRLADELLARSIEGSVDYLYRDGELVGERRYIDNRLAYAMLRRMDKLAEANPQPVHAELSRHQFADSKKRQLSPSPKTCPEAGRGIDWDFALMALRSGSEEDLCAALAMLDGRLTELEGHETDETDNPHDPELEDVTFNEFACGRIWREDDGWWTNFPPPVDFAGIEDGRWEEADYRRECSPDEAELLEAKVEAELAELAEQRSEEEAERDSFFAEIAAELEPTAITATSKRPA